MARFRYRMQSILDVKLKLETQAKQEFSAAQAALSEEEDRLRELRQRKAEYEQRAQEILTGTLDFQEVNFIQSAILKSDEYIAEQIGRVRSAETKLERARQKLQEIMQDRKMHEKLRERAFEQFLEDEKKAEGKEVDELTSYTYGQKGDD